MKIMSLASFNIDVLIVVTFLILTLAVGVLRAGRISNLRDFAIGNRSFPTGTLVSTIVATWISGSFLFVSIEKMYSQGITIILAYLMFPSIFLIMNYFFIPKMKGFLGDLSVAESMEHLYGPAVGRITAITGAVSCLGMVAVQFKIFGTLFDYFFNIGHGFSVITSSLIVILYSAFGGIRSVTITDIIQFLTFSIFLPVILFLLVEHIDLTHVSNTILDTHFFDFSKLTDYKDPNFWAFVTLVFYFTFPNFPPEIFQRILIAKNIQQVRTSFSLAFFACQLIVIMTVILAIFVYYANPNLAPNTIFNFLIDQYLYPGVRGLTVIGIIAMIMSSADSNINSSAVLLTNMHNSFKSLSETDSLRSARIYTLLLGIFALFIALSKKDLLSIILLTASFYMPIVNLPLMLSILGFRPHPKSILVGMAAGFTTSITFLFLKTNIDAIIPAMLVNALFLLGSHFWFSNKSAWVTIETDVSRKDLSDGNLEEKYSILEYLRSQLPTKDKFFILFGFVCFMTSLSTIYSAHAFSEAGHSVLVLALFQTMLACCSFFLFFALFPESVKRSNITIFMWYFTATYILSFCSIFFALLSNFDKLPLIILTFNILYLLILTRWQVASAILITGTIVSIYCYMSYMELSSIYDMFEHGNMMVMLALIAISTSIVTFLKPQQEESETNKKKIKELHEEVSNLNKTVVYFSEKIYDQEREIQRLGATAQKILNNINHELRLPVGNVMNFAEILNEGLGQLDQKEIREISQEVYENSNRLASMILNMLDLVMIDTKMIALNKKLVNISEMVEDRSLICRNIYLNDKKLAFNITIEEEIFVNIDPNYMRQVIDNLILNSITHSDSGVINIKLNKTQTSAVFTISDQGKGIAKEDIYDIFTPFKVGSKTESKAEGRGIGLALCKAVIESHGGKIKAVSLEKGAEFKFNIPLRKK